MVDDFPHVPLTEAQLDYVSDRVFEKIKALIGGSAIKALIFIASTAIIAILSYMGLHSTTQAHP